MPISAGSTIGPYTITREIGRGGMGVVYLAEDMRLKRSVAIKALPDHLQQDPDRLERFQREARLLAQVSHPNIAGIHGVEDQAGSSYLVLEYVEGPTLDQVLDRGPMSIDDAIETAIGIAAGLSAAHEAGVTHRDLKPANIKRTLDDVPKILDFGLAKNIESTSVSHPDAVTATSPAPHSPTVPGVILGTAPYMSPEQARGRPVDRRTDVWSFACVLYECLTGRRAFAGETVADTMASVIAGSPDLAALPPGTPDRLRDLLERCLRRDRDRRPRDMGDISLELEDIKQNLGRPAEAATAHSAKGYLSILAIIALVIVVSVVGGRLSATRNNAPPSASTAFILDLPEGVRLSGLERLAHELAITRDGRTVAYLADKPDGTQGLFVRDLDSFDTREITGIRNPRGPTFSPDASWLLVLEDYARLVKIPLAGGPKQTVCETDGSMREWVWLDTGFIVTRDDTLEMVSYVADTGGEPTELVRVTPEAALGIRGIDTLTAIPGGMLLGGFTDDSVEDYKIVELTIPGGEFREVLDRASHPQPTRDHLIFLRDGALLAVPWDLASRTVTGPERLVVEGVSSGSWSGTAQYAASLSGTVIYVPGDRRGEGRRLAWLEPDGTLTPMDIPQDSFTEGVRLSPDGSKLVVTTLRSKSEVWCYDLLRGTRARLNKDLDGEVWSPVFSPDGTKIAFFVTDTINGRVVVVDTDGANPKIIEPPAGGRLGVTGWIPGENALTIDRPFGSEWVVGRFDLNPPYEISRLIETPSYQARASPDGRWLAYASFRTGEDHVYVRAIDDPATERQVTPVTGGEEPEWAADGSAIYYLDANGVLFRVAFTAPAEAGAPFEIGVPEQISDEPSFRMMSYFSVARDGRIAMVQIADWEARPGQLRVMTNALSSQN